ncbi:MAG: hypothetical protein AB2A00_01665 [Myxococcota bacterium]
MSKQDDKGAPKMDAAKLEALKKQMLKNLSDPKVAERVEAAERENEEELKKRAGKVGGKNG